MSEPDPTTRTLWHFKSTSDAYHAAQSRDEIKTGHTLDIDEQAYCKVIGRDAYGCHIMSMPEHIRVVALAWSWPIAVTKDVGNLHTIDGGVEAVERFVAEKTFTARQMRFACEYAVALGVLLDRPFAAWLEALL